MSSIYRELYNDDIKSFTLKDSGIMDYVNDFGIEDLLNEWTYKGFRTDIYTHKIHKYPAMFIPQVAQKLINMYSNRGELVLDIFNGSGTSAVECKLLGRHFIGIELNPLANLIARVKTNPLDANLLRKNFEYINNKFHANDFNYEIKYFENVEYWFSQEAIDFLSKLIAIINSIRVKERNFFLVCISEIIREISWCKHSGFKMHRDAKKVNMKVTKEDMFNKFAKVSYKNIKSMEEFSKKAIYNVDTKLICEDSTKLLTDKIAPDSVDFILTSPPYGDSGTTVAYGQFSRLSNQWLGLTDSSEVKSVNIDKYLLGGKPESIEFFEDFIKKSITLKNIHDYFLYLAKSSDAKTSKKIIKRLRDILSFYYDLDKSIKNASVYLKQNKYFVLVVSSRIVKGFKLHTDEIIGELAIDYGFVLKNIFYRNIESKRMPSFVSAENIKGKVSPTMTKESIITLKKEK